MLFILNLLLHSVAFLHYSNSPELVNLPEYWIDQVLFAITLSFLLSVLNMVLKRQIHIIVLIIFRCWIIIFLGFPLSGTFTVEISLLISLLLDTSHYINYPIDIAISLMAILAVFFSQVSISVWNFTVPTVNLIGRLDVALYPLVFVVVMSVFKYKIQSLSKQKEQADRALVSNFELANINLILQQHSMEAEYKATVSERIRISQELHDTIGHALTNLRMMLEAAIRQYEQHEDDLGDLLEKARLQAHESLWEMKAVMRELRSKNNECYYRSIADLLKLIKAFKNTSIVVNLEAPNLYGTINPIIDHIVFRVVQEGITNAIQHGIASKIQIYLWKSEKDVIVSVVDNGIGCDVVIEGVGIKGMKERIEKLGGSVRAVNNPVGFNLTARIPLMAEEDSYGCDQSPDS